MRTLVLGFSHIFLSSEIGKLSFPRPPKGWRGAYKKKPSRLRTQTGTHRVREEPQTLTLRQKLGTWSGPECGLCGELWEASCDTVHLTGLQVIWWAWGGGARSAGKVIQEERGPQTKWGLNTWGITSAGPEQVGKVGRHWKKAESWCQAAALGA